MPCVSQQWTNNKIVKEIEIKISAFIVEHNISFNIADHLVDLLKTLGNNEKQILRSISCNRTKCTAIVTNVIGKSSQEKLIERLKIQKFALCMNPLIIAA